MKNALRWDIFCAVVDNYGDIGVCWRLARQLANEHGLRVRLWADDLTPLTKLRPDADAAQETQRLDGVEVRRWPKAFAETDVADVVIEAFACELPDPYLATMAARSRKPLWINLEYLSAEPWVEEAHGLPSPHPRLPLTKYFFFPGFTAKTGGLIREADYATRATTFDAAAFRAQFRLPARRKDELTISLFGYENAGLPELLDAWSHSPQPITCLVPEGRLVPAVQAFFGHRDTTMQHGHLTAHVLPFVPQQDYDELLWLCDLNFVRGEDSFVRGQWAQKPFVWHIYPQDDAAHRVKLDAFLDRYLAGLRAEPMVAVRNFWQAWNEGGDIAAAWPALCTALPYLDQHAHRWAKQLADLGDLAGKLVSFHDEAATLGR